MFKPTSTPNALDEKTAPIESEKTLEKKHAFAIATMMLISLLTFLGGFGLIGFSFLKYQYIDAGPVKSEQIFELPKGAGLNAITSKLKAERIINSEFTFKTFIKFDGGETSLKAGEYLIPPEASMRDVYDILRDGRAVLYPITIAEGLTSAQIVRKINSFDRLTGNIDVIPPEGSLLPETYLLPKTMSKRELIERMQVARDKVLNEAWANRTEGLPIKSREEAIILASVVEKETGVKSERKRVAGVFINRLNRRMRLESDPTIIYGITGGEKLGRGLRRSEIDRKTDWNTYQIDRLPKTAICNPGKASIEAVLNPMKSDEIFFVADGTGGHVFASTLSGHNKNVKAWRKIERQRKRANQ